MKRQRFIELLNLYLDCEIDSRSAGELEREILSNREHRRIYSEYCRIHRGTRLVFERFRSGEIDGEEFEISDGAHFPISTLDEGRRSKLLSFSTISAAGIAAAIALSVVILSNRNPSDTPVAQSGFALAQTDQVQSLPVVTFQVPYSTDLATDPYFRTAGYSNSNPFAFSANPMNVRVEDFSSSLRNATSFRLGTSNEVRAEQIEFEHIQLGHPEPQIFRSNPNAAPVSFEPVGFELHR